MPNLSFILDAIFVIYGLPNLFYCPESIPLVEILPLGAAKFDNIA